MSLSHCVWIKSLSCTLCCHLVTVLIHKYHQLILLHRLNLLRMSEKILTFDHPSIKIWWFDHQRVYKFNWPFKNLTFIWYQDNAEFRGSKIIHRVWAVWCLHSNARKNTDNYVGRKCWSSVVQGFPQKKKGEENGYSLWKMYILTKWCCPHIV